MSVVLCLAECACAVERTSNVAYSSNVFELLGHLVSWWLHGMPNTYFCCASCLILRDQASDFRTSDHSLLSAAGSPVTPHAPPSSLTTTFACSRAWSIIIGDNCRLDLCTITFEFRTSELSEVVSVKSYCLCRRQEYIVHNLNCLWQIRKVSVRSVTESTGWSLTSRIIGSTREVRVLHVRRNHYIKVIVIPRRIGRPLHEIFIFLL